MVDKVADSVECPACKFKYKRYTPAHTLVKACPACRAPSTGTTPRKNLPKGASRFIPKIPTGMVPRTASDEETARRTGTSTTVETAAAVATESGRSPPMATPPPRSGPFVQASSGPGGVEVPLCFGDPEVFQKGEFCPDCQVFDKCFPRVLVITLTKLGSAISK